MPRKMRKATTIVFLLIVLIVVSEVVIPKLISDSIARTLTRETASDSASVKAHSSPAIVMLAGRFDEIRIQTSMTKIDKAVFSEMRAVLKNVHLDMAALTSRQLAIQSVGNVDLVAVISQDELARIITATVKGITQPKVVVSPTGVKLTATLSLAQVASVTVDLEGKIVAEGQRIKLVTEKFSLNNVFMGNIAGKMLAEIPLIDVKKLPFGVTLKNVSTDEGRIVIFADNSSK